ncbi:MAG: hypothetical protein ACI8XB_000899 [Patiriisocius sp.]|jgi:hypothetical protein
MKIFKCICILLLITLFSVSCDQSKPKSTKVKIPSAKKEQVKVPKQQKTESIKVDQYGRSPGHPHYGHKHATGEHAKETVDSTLIPAVGKPDKFGRPPGHPHYGHNHK